MMVEGGSVIDYYGSEGFRFAAFQHDNSNTVEPL